MKDYDNVDKGFACKNCNSVLLEDCTCEDDKVDDHISNSYLDDNYDSEANRKKCIACGGILSEAEVKDGTCYSCGVGNAIVLNESENKAIVQNIEGVSLPSGTRVFIKSGLYIAGTVGNLTTSDDMGDMFVRETLINHRDIKHSGSFIHNFINAYITADGDNVKLLKPVAIALIKKYKMGS